MSEPPRLPEPGRGGGMIGSPAQLEPTYHSRFLLSFLLVTAGFGILTLVAWILTPEPVIEEQTKQEITHSRPPKHPMPPWMIDGGVAYVPAVIAFRIDRADLSDWPLPISKLRCDNTQSCLYGVEWCEPLTISNVGGESISLHSPAGPRFQATGPWTLVFQTRNACRRKLKQIGDARYLLIESRWETYSLGE
jgi:hypothetical protein